MLTSRPPTVQRLEPNWLCRDPVVCKEWSEDALCHDTGTLEGLAGMLDRGAGLDQDAVVVRDGEGEGGVTRLFVGHGTEDRVTSFETSKRWFARLNVKDKEFKEYEGWYHKCEFCSIPSDVLLEMLTDSQCTPSLEKTRLLLQVMSPTGSLLARLPRHALRHQKSRASYNF